MRMHGWLKGLLWPLLFVSGTCFSLDPVEEWVRTYDGGVGDWGWDVALDSAGNIYVVCCYWPPTCSWRTIKFDPSGSIAWAREYADGDEPYALAVDPAGYVYVTGPSDDNDALTVKYDPAGNIVWTRTYDGGSSAYGADVVLDASGNAYVACNWRNGTQYDYRILKYDFTGNIIWDRVYGGLSSEYIEGIALDDSGCIYVAGYLYEGGVFVAKCDQAGNMIWDRIYDKGDDQWAYGIDVDSQGNSYVVGCIDNGTDYYCLIIKYDLNGNLVWDKNADDGLNGELYRVVVGPGDKIFAAGCVWGKDYLATNRAIKFDSSANIVWDRMQDFGDSDNWYQGIAVSAVGEIFVTGSLRATLNYDMLLTKYRQTDSWDPSDNLGLNGNQITPTQEVQSHGPHVINEIDLADWYRVSVTEPGAYYFTASYTSGTAAPGGIGDVKAELYLDPAGTVLAASDDNGEENYQFKLVFSATQTGTYYLKVNTVTEGADWYGYLNYWYIVPGKLKSAMSVSPSLILVGQNATVELTVTNTGGSAVTNVVPSIGIVSGASLVSYIGGPVPSSFASLDSGGSVTFTWTYSVSGAGLVEFNASASGTEQGLGQSVLSSSFLKIETKAGASLKAGLFASPPAALAGESFSLLLTVTNTGGLKATNVIPVLSPVLGGSLVSHLSGANPAGFVSLDPGESGTFTWTYSVTGAGIVMFSATATGKDEGTGGNIQASSLCQFEGLSMARLSSCLSVVPSSAFVGSPVCVTLTITNTGNLAAESVIGQLGIEAGSILVSPLFLLSSGPVTLNAGQMQVFSWSCTLSGAGTVVFSCTSTGTEEGTGNPLFCWAKAFLTGKALPAVPSASLAKEKLSKGQFLIAPNVYDSTKPGNPIVFVLKGDSGGLVELGIYDESGEYVGMLKAPLDGLGEGVVSWSGEAISGKKLGSGLYWVAASGAGVSGRKRFVVKSGGAK